MGSIFYPYIVKHFGKINILTKKGKEYGLTLVVIVINIPLILVEKDLQRPLALVLGDLVYLL